jgi:hypothetical protein
VSASGKKRVNAEWHRENRMPEKATVEQRIAWHLEHRKLCGCRPIPTKLLAAMKDRGLV